MKTVIPSVLLALCVALNPAHAAGKKKGGGGKPAPAPASAAAASPTAALEPYIVNIDQLLALRRPPKAQPQLFAQAEGRLAVLRQEFVTQGTAAADAEKPKFAAAVTTCDALTAALHERQQTLGNLRASNSVSGSSKLEQGPRKDNLSQGVKGELPKAVAEITEGKREKAANKAAKEVAAGNDNALNAMAVNRWSQRSAVLKQQILADYAKIR